MHTILFSINRVTGWMNQTQWLKDKYLNSLNTSLTTFNLSVRYNCGNDAR